MHWHDFWNMGWMMWLFWIALFVLLGLAVVWISRSMRRSDDREQSPEQILKQRYARGEIDKQEYERKLEELRR